MTTISSLTSTILQDAMSQLSQGSVSSTSTSSQTQTVDSSASTPLQAISGSGSTTVTLGSNASTPVTYSSTGTITQAQAEQLVQIIDTNVSNTISQLFSGSTANSGDPGLSALLGATDPSANSSNTALLSLLNSVYPAASPSSSTTTQTIQNAISASQNPITNILSSL